MSASHTHQRQRLVHGTRRAYLGIQVDATQEPAWMVCPPHRNAEHRHRRRGRLNVFARHRPLQPDLYERQAAWPLNSFAGSGDELRLPRDLVLSPGHVKHSPLDAPVKIFGSKGNPTEPVSREAYSGPAKAGDEPVIKWRSS
jgi:hypothetical protein